MSEKFKSLSKDAVVPVSLGLLICLVAGVWTLAVRVLEWENRLDSFEAQLGSRWSYYMARQAWAEAEKLNEGFKAPDIKAIRDEYKSSFQ